MNADDMMAWAHHGGGRSARCPAAWCRPRPSRSHLPTSSALPAPESPQGIGNVLESLGTMAVEPQGKGSVLATMAGEPQGKGSVAPAAPRTLGSAGCAAHPHGGRRGGTSSYHGGSPVRRRRMGGMLDAAAAAAAAAGRLRCGSAFGQALLGLCESLAWRPSHIAASRTF